MWYVSLHFNKAYGYFKSDVGTRIHFLKWFLFPTSNLGKDRNVVGNFLTVLVIPGCLALAVLQVILSTGFPPVSAHMRKSLETWYFYLFLIVLALAIGALIVNTLGL